MGCQETIFRDFIQENEGRKTVSKREAVNVMLDLLDECKMFEHMPGCYLPGQTPPTLCKQHIEENKLIRQWNENIDRIKEKNNVTQMELEIDLYNDFSKLFK